MVRILTEEAEGFARPARAPAPVNFGSRRETGGMWKTSFPEQFFDGAGFTAPTFVERFGCKRAKQFGVLLEMTLPRRVIVKGGQNLRSDGVLLAFRKGLHALQDLFE